MYLFKRHGVFYLHYLDKQENRLRRISTKTKRHQEALAFLTEFKENLSEHPTAKSISIVDFQKEYVAFLQSRYSRSYVRLVESTFRILNQFLTENNLGDCERLQSLSASIFERFISSKFQEAPTATGAYHRTLKAALNRAMSWGYLTENSLNRVKLPKIPKRLPVFIGESELNAICINAGSEELAKLFRFAFYTGMRRSEILNLEWQAVNLAERIIKVSNTETFTTKSKSERIIPINETLFQLLTNIQPKVYSIGKNYVFHKPNGQSYAVSYVSHEFKEAARKAGVGEDIHLHSLRHSFASNLVKRGVPIVTVKELLGHTDIKTTMIYSHVRREDLVNAVKMLEPTN